MLGTSSVLPAGIPSAFSRRVTSSSSLATCAGSDTFDMATMSGRACITAARSACPSVSSGLIRTAASTPAARQRGKMSTARARACGRRSGGVKSSSSWISTSAPQALADMSAPRSAPGKNNQQRRSAGGRRSTTWCDKVEVLENLADCAAAALITGSTLTCWCQARELGPGVAGAIRMRMIKNAAFSALPAASAPSNAACGQLPDLRHFALKIAGEKGLNAEI